MTQPQTTSRSAELFERAPRVMPGGVSPNTVLRAPYPPYADHGTGCRITDIEGVTRLDCSKNMASLIHGHAYKPIIDAVTAQLARGSAMMMATEAEVLYGEHLASRSPAALAYDVAAGRVEPGLQRQESDLNLNPRRVR